MFLDTCNSENASRGIFVKLLHYYVAIICMVAMICMVVMVAMV